MKTQTPIIQLFEQHDFRLGRLLCFSKSVYRKTYPDNDVYFNANVYSDSGKEWYGDLDLTLDGKVLEKIAKKAKCKLYVLPEMYRFVDKPVEELIKDAAKIYGE
jgi:hypothetical protein